jgi:hypothetical protein
MNALVVIGVSILLFLAFGAGAWLEQGGKSKDSDYDDD